MREDGIAVGRRLRDARRRHVAAGADDVLHHYALAAAQELAELRSDQARDDVDRPARRERHRDADRFVGVGLRERSSRDQDSEKEKHPHVVSYLIAKGLVGEPTAPVIGRAGATNRNS